MTLNNLELVRLSDNQKLFFSKQDDANTPDFLKKCPAMIDCIFLFLGESPTVKGYGHFIPTNVSVGCAPFVFSGDISCFVPLLEAKPLRVKKDSGHKYKESLELLSNQVTLVIAALDNHFAKNKKIPEKESKNLAMLSNALDLANDRARHCLGLQIDGESKNKYLKHLLDTF